MNSDEDIYEENDDTDSLLYDDGDDFYGDDIEEAPMDYYSSHDPDNSDHNPQKNYTVLKESDIIRRQENDITQVCTVPSVSRIAAAILLRHFNWSVSKVHDAVFDDEEKVRKTVGILENAVAEVPRGKHKQLLCGICFEFYYRDGIFSAGCGHPYCGDCWTGYITTSIKDGPGCLMLRCPEPSCAAAIGRDMIDRFASDEDKDKYSRYIVRSYVEESRKIKWCPAPGCEYAVEFVVGSKNFDVSCLCSYSFCWNCSEDAHRPVDCDTVAKWVFKNSSESENVTWILANSKPCPRCKKPIEKNQGCMHMTCRAPCKFEFCWLCLGSWSDHGSSTGGFNSCNRYKTAKMNGEIDEEERKREMAKNYLNRYTHYYERWAGNQNSRQKAIADLHKAQTEHIDKLIELHLQPHSQLMFIIEAWQQIIECRRVLKWTYAYGYYLPEHEHAKKRLFEYLQEQAESGLERLHQCAEKDLEQFLDDNGSLAEGFKEFQSKLAGLTRVTRNYFENLVRALENGLEDVHSCSLEQCQANEHEKRRKGEQEGRGKKKKSR